MVMSFLLYKFLSKKYNFQRYTCNKRKSNNAMQNAKKYLIQIYLNATLCEQSISLTAALLNFLHFQRLFFMSYVLL